MSSESSDLTRGHSRNKSGARASRPRSSTKGPLDISDTPLSDPLTSPSAQLSPRPRIPGGGQRSPGGPRSPARPPTQPVVRTTIQKDFGFLLRPEIYHPVASVNIPAAFRRSSALPDANASVADLVNGGHFRAAAVAAVQELTSTAPNSPPVGPSDHNRIFDLLHTRLACLTLIDATQIAAQEVRALGDMNNAAIYVDETTGEHLVPWELRVLNVRLQAIGFGDPRRAVMSYHELAREAREQVGKAAARHDNTARELWKARLLELGIKVAGALIEMDDLTGAAYHLSSLKDDTEGKMALTKALLWLHLGDLDAAKRCAASRPSYAVHTTKVISALCDMADGDYASALAEWTALGDETDDEMVGVNKAVCLLYTGNLDSARNELESLVESGFSSHTLLFNLATIYELCTEQNRTLKTRLVEKTAALEPSARGWERTNADFKL
ncbi:hypothetical protein F5X68DRAFT_235070 [Plectosphaerella plurivora]|uniref:Tetratricopeptide repeat protein 15 n=1 Tax=Plectosphaerella plurivora TaxID=936078 RepID=A0A9P8V6N1_9PEZI|nr:hypothetical protein F5X68DRAFT_235070 [Plectosphaerella plurivora]